MSIFLWSLSKIHSNKQKLLRRRTTRRHRYTALLLPLLRDVFIWECWLILGAWVSVGRRRVAEPFVIAGRHESARPPQTICLGFLLFAWAAHSDFLPVVTLISIPGSCRTHRSSSGAERTWSFKWQACFSGSGVGEGRCQSPVNTWCESLYSVIFFSQLQQHHSATHRDHKLYHSPDTSEVSCLTNVLDHHPM